MSAPTAPDGVEVALERWLDTYAREHRDQLDEDFARWLAEEYVPIAGSWHY
jgi:hypothetical protein